jgi:hypothetical protein
VEAAGTDRTALRPAVSCASREVGTQSDLKCPVALVTSWEPADYQTVVAS